MRSPQEISSSLSILADLMDIAGENEFKIRAHRVASEICGTFNAGTEHLLALIACPGIPKIGENLAKKINELALSYESEDLNQLKKIVPLSVLELRRVPGLGPKKVKVLWDELRLENLEALELACQSGKLISLKGFGAKQQNKILEGIEQLKRYKGRMLLSRGKKLFEIEKEIVEKNFPKSHISSTGELRRSCEVLLSVDLMLILTTLEATQLADLNRKSGYFMNVKEEEGLIELLTDRSEVLRIYVVEPHLYWHKLLETTGPSEFTTWLQPEFPQKLASIVDSEKDIFIEVGKNFIPPECREIEHKEKWQSSNQGDYADLIEVGDIRGIVHCHSTYSDGVDSLRDMAIAAKGQGFGYIGISDHSISAGYAGGLTLEKIQKQHFEIEKLNEELAPFRILKGIESDIVSDGNLDYPDEILERFDFVIASIHSGFQMSREEMTRRIVKALRNPFTSILGHPTGRLLLEREGYALDLEEVISIAASERVVIEINSNPYRLDLDWRLIPYALNLGVKLSINPDAHRISGFADIQFGVAVGRKAALRKEDVISCYEVEEFLSAIR